MVISLILLRINSGHLLATRCCVAGGVSCGSSQGGLAQMCDLGERQPGLPPLGLGKQTAAEGAVRSQVPGEAGHP